jgi:hypothetical protein
MLYHDHHLAYTNFNFDFSDTGIFDWQWTECIKCKIVANQGDKLGVLDHAIAAVIMMG